MKKLKHLEDMNVVERRMEILVAGRLRNRNRMEEAIKKQDELSKKSGSWSGEKEIKKQRKKRYRIGI